MNRRHFCLSLAALSGLPKLGFALTPAATVSQTALIGAAWRGPNAGDTYQAGVLAADWDTKKLAIRYELPLPTRPHGLLAEADGGLLVIGVRPGILVRSMRLRPKVVVWHASSALVTRQGTWRLPHQRSAPSTRLR